jgi:sulfite exporter TauE/SafE
MIGAAFILGLTGSFHCAGMCSPLAMAVVNVNSRAFANRLLYNTGRLFTYVVLGAIVSSAGFLLPIWEYQNLLSIIIGIILLLAGFGIMKTHIPILTKSVARFSQHIKKLFGFFIQKKNVGSILILGALNGMLPCGLLLIALSYCITLQSAGEGILFMLAFGVSTLPVMLGFTSILPVIMKKFDFNISYITRGLLILSGVVLIARVFLVHLHHESSIERGIIDIVLCR